MSSDSKEPSADQAAPFDWRAIIPPHPAAELFPLMAEAELKELAADIKANGVVDSIVIFHDRDDQKSLLDGRNRLDALALLGLLNIGNNYLRAVDVGGREMAVHHVFEKDDENPYALALSYNVHRRHLTAEQKRDLIAKVLKVTPGASNNSIAKQVKADDKTVAAVRRELEANSEIPNKPRVEASGRNARGRKAGSTPKPKAETPVLTVTGIKRRAKALGVRFSGRDDTFGFKVIFGDRAWGNLNLDGASARLDEIEREIQAKTGTITGNGDDKAKLDEPQPNGSGNSDPDSDGVEKMKQALGAAEETQAPAEDFSIADSDQEAGAYLEALGPDRFFAALQYAPKLKAEIERRKGRANLAKALATISDPTKTLTPALITKAIDFLPADLFVEGFIQAQRLQAALEEANAAKRLATSTYTQTELLKNSRGGMSPEAVRLAADRAEERSKSTAEARVS
jgi:hypothetical protein